MIANVIFPAPSAAYIVGFFIPVAVLLAMATEIGIFWWMQRRAGPPPNLIVVVIALNGISWIAGMYLSLGLPSGLIPVLTENGATILQPGPRWGMMALLSYPFACAVSTVIEYLGLRLIDRKRTYLLPLRTVAAANAASYVVLAGTALVWFSR